MLFEFHFLLIKLIYFSQFFLHYFACVCVFFFKLSPPLNNSSTLVDIRLTFFENTFYVFLNCLVSNFRKFLLNINHKHFFFWWIFQLEIYMIFMWRCWQVYSENGSFNFLNKMTSNLHKIHHLKDTFFFNSYFGSFKLQEIKRKKILIFVLKKKKHSK